MGMIRDSNTQVSEQVDNGTESESNMVDARYKLCRGLWNHAGDKDYAEKFMRTQALVKCFNVSLQFHHFKYKSLTFLRSYKLKFTFPYIYFRTAIPLQSSLRASELLTSIQPGNSLSTLLRYSVSRFPELCLFS